MPCAGNSACKAPAMHALLSKISPSATDTIRADHTRVMASFHRYKLDAAPEMRRALVGSICLALEVHAQIEEEIFYPAMRTADARILDKLEPEHQEMRRLIAMLRSLEPTAPRAGELVRHKARAMPPATMLAAAGAVVAGLYLLRGRR